MYSNFSNSYLSFKMDSFSLGKGISKFQQKVDVKKKTKNRIAHIHLCSEKS